MLGMIAERAIIFIMRIKYLVESVRMNPRANNEKMLKSLKHSVSPVAIWPEAKEEVNAINKNMEIGIKRGVFLNLGKL